MNTILIKNGILITMDKEDTIIKNGAVYVEDDRIVAIGKTQEIMKKYIAEKVIDASWKIVMPGLINAHSHMSVIDFIRGLGTDMTGTQRIKIISPIIDALTEEDVHVGALLGCIGNIRMGSTYVIECYSQYKPSIDIIAEAVERVGIRAGLWQAYTNEIEEVMGEGIRVVKKWHTKADGKIKVWLGPTLFSVSPPEHIVKIHELAEKYEIGIFTHLAANLDDVKLYMERSGKRCVEGLYDLGVLGPNFIAVHAVWISDKEIDLLRRTETRIVHCPTANMFNSQGVSPVPKMLRAGIRVALGTDIYQDMLTTIRCVTYMHKVHNLDPLAMTAKVALRMATIDGAKAIGQEKEIGSLEIGKKADIITIDYKKSHLVPLHDPISSVVYCASPYDIDNVIVNGKIIMEDSVIKTVDEQEVIQKAQEVGVNLVQRAEVA